jgi:hypothetical protein
MLLLVQLQSDIIIRSTSELEEFSLLLSNPKVSQLAKMLEEVNPERKTTTTTTSSDIFRFKVKDVMKLDLLQISLLRQWFSGSSMRALSFLQMSYHYHCLLS